MATFPTQSELLNNYFQYLQIQLQDKQINIDPANDAILNILGNVECGMLAGVYANLYIYWLNSRPTTANGQFLQYLLADWGLPPRSAGTYALGTVKVSIQSSQPITILAGTKLTDTTKKIFFRVMSDTLIITGNESISIRSEEPTSGYFLAYNAPLYFLTPVNGITTISVQNITDGTGVESIPAVKMRLLQSIQNYTLGGTKQDYINWCRQADTNVTDVIIPQTELNQVNIYLIGGELNITNVLLNPAIEYSRSVNFDIVGTVTKYIEGKRVYTDKVIIDTCSTYVIEDLITISVQLAYGFTLDTTIANPINKDYSISIKNLILQEFRRAIILSSFNAQQDSRTGYEEKFYITYAILSEQLYESLLASTNNPGKYAQILLNVKLTLINPIGIVVPYSGGQRVYDLKNTAPSYYDNITVNSLI